jgi:hypothetical protein
VNSSLTLTLIAVGAAFAAWGTDTPDRHLARSVPVASLVSRSAIPGGFRRLSEKLPPTQRVEVVVEASVTLDSRSGIYTYSYRLLNDRTSLNDVDFFALAPVGPPDTMFAPVHWTGLLYPYGDSGTAVVWAVTDVGELPTGHVDTGNVPPSSFDMRPGQAVEGFCFRTRAGPGLEPVRFFASGFDTLPGGEEAPGDEDPQPDSFQRSVCGLTLGPGPPSREKR